MDTTEAFEGLESASSGRVYETADPAELPDDVGAVEPAYDYDAVDPDALLTGTAGDGGPTPGHWRYDALLPFPASTAVSASEGQTPLVSTARLAEELDVAAVYVKDEGRNPTGTVLDRGFSVAMTAVAAVDDQLETTYTDLTAFATPYRHEGTKTVAFEVVADLGAAPDVVVVPTGSGEVVTGVYKGFTELTRVGAIDAVPRVVAAQPSGCAPVAAAVERGLTEPEPWSTPDTICGELEVPDPAGGRAAIEAVTESGGTAVAVDDDDILASAVAVAQNEVIEMGATGGAAPAGAWALAEAGKLSPDDTVVLLNNDAGLKTPDVLRSHLMGQGI